MLGFVKVPCIFCDRPMFKKEALRLRGRNAGAQNVGVFLDRYAFGHADCGGLRLAG